MISKKTHQLSTFWVVKMFESITTTVLKVLQYRYHRFLLDDLLFF